MFGVYSFPLDTKVIYPYLKSGIPGRMEDFTFINVKTSKDESE